jgi:sec-independent protein translocase protein TatB
VPISTIERRRRRGEHGDLRADGRADRLRAELDRVRARPGDLVRFDDGLAYVPCVGVLLAHFDSLAVAQCAAYLPSVGVLRVRGGQARRYPCDMFFGITIEKLLVIGVIAALLVGPERLPRYAESFARWSSGPATTCAAPRPHARGGRPRDRRAGLAQARSASVRPASHHPRRADGRHPAPARPAAPAVAAETPAAAARCGIGGALLASATAMNAASAAERAGRSGLPGAKVFSAEELPPYDSEAT